METTNLRIDFYADGDIQDIEDVCSNFTSSYPELSCCMEERDFEQNVNEFYISWEGNFAKDVFDKICDDVLRMTHHAEGLYENTEAEHVHVEVRIDGEWHGV